MPDKHELVERVFPFQSPKGHYVAQACGIVCADDKFFPASDAFKKWFEEDRGMRIELIKVFGGAKAFAGGPSPERDVLLNQLKLSVTFHHVAHAVLVFQIDCAAYRGSEAFDHDEYREYEHHRGQYIIARDFLNREMPEIAVMGYIMDYDGFYQVKE